MRQVTALSPVRAARGGYNPLIIPANLVQVGTDADLLTKVLWTADIPGGTFHGEDVGVRIVVSGQVAATVNNKTIRLLVGGSTVVSDTGAINGGGFRIVCDLFRFGGTAFQAVGHSVMLRTDLCNFVNLGPFNPLNPLTVVMNAQNAVAVANEIVKRQATIERITR